jgi:hypothetical protein
MPVTLGNTDLTISGQGSNPVKVRQTVYGYSSTYNVLQLGEQANGQSVSLFVDPSTNSSGSFNGNGRELLVPQDFDMISPTANNTTFKNVIRFTDGRVTMPNQPSFLATKTNANQVGPGVISFNNVVSNVGSHYSTSTNRFTAPVAGVYWIFTSLLTDSTRRCQASIRKNGSAVVTMEQFPGQYQQGALGIAVPLGVNDFVEVHLTTSSDGVYGTSNYSSFSGFLIG